MAKTLVTVLLGLCWAATPACGRKGPLELPPGRAPMPVTDLKAAPFSETVLLTWTNPVKAVSGRPLGPLEAVEIWVFDGGLAAGGPALSSEEVEKTARLVRRIPREELGSAAMSFSFAVPPRSPGKLAFVVRVIDRRGRASDFSAPAAVDLVRRVARVERPAGGAGSLMEGEGP
jgi:predicted small lipoprotein YifL